MNLITRAAFSESSKACYFVVQCSWDNSPEYRQRLADGIREAESQGIELLQAVTCYGGDEVEDFLFEHLPKSFTYFPAFIHVKTKSLIYPSTVVKSQTYFTRCLFLIIMVSRV